MATDPRQVPLALRLRIKAMLDAKLTVAEIFERLAATPGGDEGGRVDPDLIAAALRSLSPGTASPASDHAAEIGAHAADIFAAPPQPASRAPQPQPEPPQSRTHDARWSDTAQPAPAAPVNGAPEEQTGPTDPPITNDVSRLFSLLNLQVGGDDRGTVIEFISSHRREGTSTIAREFAQICALHSDRPVLLLDLDLKRDKQYGHYAGQSGRDKELRRPGGAVNLGPDLGQLVRLDKEISGLGAGEHLISAHRVGHSALHVSRVNPYVRQRKAVPQMTKAPAVWDQLRRATAVTVVDAPPFTDSFDGLSISGLVDQVIVVIEAESTRTPVVAELCDRLASQNAAIAGAVFNKRRFYIPRFIYRWI